MDIYKKAMAFFLMIKSIVEFYSPFFGGGVSLVTQSVKNLPAMRETWVQSLGWEVPLEGSMATCSSIPTDRGTWQATVHGVAKETDSD